MGVDLEPLREVPDLAGVAACAFRPGELSAFRAAGGDSRAFLRLWTRKEALLKALGIGLAGLDLPGPLPGEEQVEVVDLDVGLEHVAALAVASVA